MSPIEMARVVAVVAFLSVAAYSTARFVWSATRRGPRSGLLAADVPDLSHALMGVAMALMISPAGAAVPPALGVAAFTVLAAWFAARLRHDGLLSRAAALPTALPAGGDAGGDAGGAAGDSGGACDCPPPAGSWTGHPVATSRLTDPGHRDGLGAWGGPGPQAGLGRSGGGGGHEGHGGRQGGAQGWHGGGQRGGHSGYHLHHLVGCAAMVVMYLTGHGALAADAIAAAGADAAATGGAQATPALDPHGAHAGLPALAALCWAFGLYFLVAATSLGFRVGERTPPEQPPPPWPAHPATTHPATTHPATTHPTTAHPTTTRPTTARVLTSQAGACATEVALSAGMAVLFFSAL